MFERLKKFFFRFTLTTLSAGASLILGLLSFGGMYALWPALIPALISFALSVAYEGEIYTRNLERAFEKLFTNNYFKHQLAKEFLRKKILEEDEEKVFLPFFLQRYKLALRKRDQAILDEIEAEFAAQLCAESFDENEKHSKYAKDIFKWTHEKPKNGELSLHDQFVADYKKRKWSVWGIKAFSIITSLFMGLGTTYLLVEAFSIIPFLAAISAPMLPFIIVPMAAICGIAYGLLTYNAMTNLMANDTLRTWYRKIRDDLKENPWSLKGIGMAITASLLFAMALVLTICTAGTWWTVANEVKPLFSWMAKMPAFIMGVINPIITGISSIIFNIENTSGTLSMIENGINSNKPVFTPLWDNLKKAATYLWEKENVLQWLNPFRLVLVFVILPLRYLFFVGHLISIGVTADRIPGLSSYFSAFLGCLSEGFEDAHYFFDDHSHPTNLESLLEERLSEDQGHEHTQDLPSWIIEKISMPFYALAGLWSSFFSLFNHKENRVSPKQACDQLYRAVGRTEQYCEHQCGAYDHAPDTTESPDDGAEYPQDEETGDANTVRPTKTVQPHVHTGNCCSWRRPTQFFSSSAYCGNNLYLFAEKNTPSVNQDNTSANLNPDPMPTEYSAVS